MRLKNLFVNGLGYGSFAVWFAAIWCRPIQTELALSGLLMFVLSFIIEFGQTDDKNEKSGKEGE